MRTPAFWYPSNGRLNWRSLALAPLAAIFAFATARRVAKEPQLRADIPVICVGNINAGGTGKTPTCIALVGHLASHGIAAHIVSRGYGGSELGPLRVDERNHSAADVGDEPLLLSAFAPTWVSRKRAEGVRAAQKAGAQAIILDDGFQNPSVHKDISIVVVDAKRGFGNGRVIPAGPLREPVAKGLERANLLLSIGELPDQQTFLHRFGSKIKTPHLTAKLVPLQTGADLAGQNVFAFAGIGHPEKFLATLQAMGANIAGSEALQDHQPLTNTLMARIEKKAETLGAQLVTTEKDAVRLPPSFRGKVLTVPVRLAVDDWAALDAELGRVGAIASSGRP